jgi:hypothetical protein
MWNSLGLLILSETLLVISYFSPFNFLLHDFKKIIQFACQKCVVYGNTYLGEQFFLLMKWSTSSEMSQLTNTHSIINNESGIGLNIKP